MDSEGGKGGGGEKRVKRIEGQGADGRMGGATENAAPVIAEMKQVGKEMERFSARAECDA